MLSETEKEDVIADESPPPSIFRMMLSKLCPTSKELFASFLLLLAVVSILDGTRLKTRKAREPELFIENSLIHNFPHGNLDDVFKVASASVFSLICYYAPWDSASQEVRGEIEIVARLLSEKVTFLAVNCWNPESSCRSRFLKIPYYPIIVMHVRGYKGIVYKGPLEAGYISRFVMEATKRVVKIDDVEEVNSLLQRKDAVVLGYFNITSPSVDSNLPKAFTVFYSTALKALESDFVGVISFGVIVDPSVAKQVGLKSFGIAVRSWTHSEVYPNFENFTVSLDVAKFFDWISQATTHSVKWLTLKGAVPYRGHELSKQIQRGPTLVLFSPRNMWRPDSSDHQLLMQISAEYFDCSASEKTSEFVKRLTETRRKLSSSLALDKRMCAETLSKSFIGETISLNDGFCSSTPPIFPDDLLCGVENASFPAPISFQVRSYDRLPSVGIRDKRVLLAMEFENKLSCRLLKKSRNTEENLTSIPTSTALVRGLGCYTLHVGEEEALRPLRFIAIDTNVHAEFANIFGASNDESFVVILDAKEESHYLLPGPITESKLVNLVANYSHGTIPRSKFTGGIRSECLDRETDCVDVNELDSSNFEEVVNNRKQDLVVLLYTPWCGFCSSANHIFLTVAQQFKEFSKEVKFVRVDSDANTLPWEYDVPAFPTVLYLPFDRWKDGMMFPYNVPLELESLLKFVLANASTRLQWKYSLSDCDEACLAKVRAGVRVRIGSLLSKYRAGVRHGVRSRLWRKGILSTLQRYRAMYWAFTDPDLIYRFTPV
ncbi:unnamed protein product [Notodromas monacha]|uniref:Thioredoxin domain-containing protein n=1 Tax=Notodromas monacha TaxID=399045 RepID=A0A7R9BJZ2_9CRUS|nr:unnamed protein product [Notodromas monacha]CAG0916632.1 unnamed protein product [Notodromas monacha]